MAEELSYEGDTATKPSMEGRNVKDKKSRASSATLMAVLWTVTGAPMAAGAPAVKLVEVGLQASTSSLSKINIGCV